MTREELIDAIGAVGEEYLERSESAGMVSAEKEVRMADGKSNRKWKNISKWQKRAALAACACLVLLVGVPLLIQKAPGMGSSNEGAGGGSNNSDGSTVFMSYAGPVFPMTALEGGEALTVERDITFDFEPWIPRWYSNEQRLAELKEQVPNLTREELAVAAKDYEKWYPEGGYYRASSDIMVEDTYTLTNTTAKKQTVQLLYPFVSSMRDLEENQPILTDKAGAKLETVLHMGGYSGGFQAVAGAENQELLLNIEEITGWEQYKALLSEEAYRKHALYYQADVSDIPVVVYRFTDEYGPEATEKMPNPSIRVMFELDEEKTQVLSYGFNGGYCDSEKGIRGRNFSVRQENDRDYGEPRFLIVIGEDVMNMETTAYVTGGWDTEDTIENAGVTITREETDMDTILREIVALEHAEVTGYQEGAKVDFETYYRMFVDMLESYGMLSEHPVARYEDGMLEFMDVYGLKRVCYLETEVTVPAGKSITVTASMEKDASYDYYCAHTKNQGINGYDMVTKLGSSLTFSKMTAHIKDYDLVEIVRQNFGFDLENNVKVVQLSGEQEHYYLEVRKRAREDSVKN